MKIDRNLYQIRAEVLLNYLYPEMEKEWMALFKGTFFRNYNEDVLALYEDEKKVYLARDGFLRLLPEGLLTKDDDLKGEDVSQKFKDLEWRRELLNEAFSPFDTYIFKKKLAIERNASQLLQEKLEYILKAYFDFDMAAETSELVKEAAVILPFVKQYKGDFHFVANLLGALMECKVEMSTGRYSHLDTTICWLPKVRYNLLIPDLTPESYNGRMKELEPLVQFIREWFIPFDVLCEVKIKEYHYMRKSQQVITLDYNTELNQ